LTQLEIDMNHMIA